MRQFLMPLATAIFSSFVMFGIANAATVVNMELQSDSGQMTIKADKTSVPAGKVTFRAHNASKHTEHEVLIVRLKSDQVKSPDSLPFNNEKGKFFEDKVDALGEVPERKPGESGEITLDLTKGTYMLVCNIAGHYRAKMYTMLTVQ